MGHGLTLTVVWVAAVNCTELADENWTLGRAGSSVVNGGAAHVRTGATSPIASLSEALKQGLSKAEIARMLGVSRQTLYHWINTEQLDRDLDNGPVRYTPRPPVARERRRN
jgi:hypothetical protein